MSDADLDQVLRAGRPPARDPAFTMRVVKQIAAEEARSGLMRRSVRAAAWALALILLAPIILMAPSAEDPVFGTVLLAVAGILAALALARALGRRQTLV